LNASFFFFFFFFFKSATAMGEGGLRVLLPRRKSGVPMMSPDDYLSADSDEEADLTACTGNACSPRG